MAGSSRRSIFAAILVPLLVLAMAGWARAATITVTTVADPSGASGSCSLRQAITNANNQNQSGSTDCAAGTGTDSIVFNLSGTILLGSTLPTITNTSPRSLTIDGSGQTITVDGASLNQVFIENSGAALTLKSLTVAHGWNLFGAFIGGGGVDNSGALTVTNCTFFDNFDFDAGGGIINRAGASLAVTNSTFSVNSADEGDGGAIFNDTGAKLTITNSTFSGNNDFDLGGGIINSGTMTVTNSAFVGNSADNGGGGIENSASLTVTNSTSRQQHFRTRWRHRDLGGR